MRGIHLRKREIYFDTMHARNIYLNLPRVHVEKIKSLTLSDNSKVHQVLGKIAMTFIPFLILSSAVITYCEDRLFLLQIESKEKYCLETRVHYLMFHLDYIFVDIV